jgi:hypothetical protein
MLRRRAERAAKLGEKVRRDAVEASCERHATGSEAWPPVEDDAIRVSPTTVAAIQRPLEPPRSHWADGARARCWPTPGMDAGRGSRVGRAAATPPHLAPDRSLPTLARMCAALAVPVALGHRFDAVALLVHAQVAPIAEHDLVIIVVVLHTAHATAFVGRAAGVALALGCSTPSHGLRSGMITVGIEQ